MYPMVVMIEWSEEFCDGKRPFMSQSTYSELGVQVLDEGEVFLVVLLCLLKFLLGIKKHIVLLTENWAKGSKNG